MGRLIMKNSLFEMNFDADKGRLTSLYIVGDKEKANFIKFLILLHFAFGFFVHLVVLFLVLQIKKLMF